MSCCRGEQKMNCNAISSGHTRLRAATSEMKTKRGEKEINEITRLRFRFGAFFFFLRNLSFITWRNFEQELLFFTFSYGGKLFLLSGVRRDFLICIILLPTDVV